MCLKCQRNMCQKQKYVSKVIVVTDPFYIEENVRYAGKIIFIVHQFAFHYGPRAVLTGWRLNHGRNTSGNIHLRVGKPRDRDEKNCETVDVNCWIGNCISENEFPRFLPQSSISIVFFQLTDFHVFMKRSLK